MSSILLPCSQASLQLHIPMGGPVSAIWGWILVMTTNFFVALSMAEIVSAYPIAGGPYFW